MFSSHETVFQSSYINFSPPGSPSSIHCQCSHCPPAGHSLRSCMCSYLLRWVSISPVAFTRYIHTYPAVYSHPLAVHTQHPEQGIYMSPASLGHLSFFRVVSISFPIDLCFVSILWAVCNPCTANVLFCGVSFYLKWCSLISPQF